MLRPEQEFQLQAMRIKIRELTRDELEAEFIDLTASKMIQENGFKQQMKGQSPGLAQEQNQCGGK